MKWLLKENSKFEALHTDLFDLIIKRSTVQQLQWQDTAYLIPSVFTCHFGLVPTPRLGKQTSTLRPTLLLEAHRPKPRFGLRIFYENMIDTKVGIWDVGIVMNTVVT